MKKAKTKKLPYLVRIDVHMDEQRKVARKCPIYRMRTVEVDDKGKVVQEVSA
jgi:hypothetical protein